MRYAAINPKITATKMIPPAPGRLAIYTPPCSTFGLIVEQSCSLIYKIATKFY
jgi:hypothetical protein